MAQRLVLEPGPESIEPAFIPVEGLPSPSRSPASPSTLWQKIAKAMVLVGYVQKRGKNQFHKYSYATAADVAEKAREAFIEVGLLFLPTVKSVETREKTTIKGGLTYITRVTMTYLIHDAVDDVEGSTRYYEFDMVGEGQDDGDKSVYKAITGAHKYALLQLLCVSTGDDPEADEKTDQTVLVAPTITDAQLFALQALIVQTNTEEAKVCTFFQVVSLGELSANQYDKACALLEKKK